MKPPTKLNWRPCELVTQHSSDSSGAVLRERAEILSSRAALHRQKQSEIEGARGRRPENYIKKACVSATAQFVP